MRQGRRRPLYEIEPAGHAGAAVDQQGQSRTHGFVPGEVEDLRHAVLEDAERALGESLDETSVLVLDRRFDHDARDVGLLDDFEGFQHHGVADLPAQRIGNGDGNLAPFEWILIGPLDDIGRTVLIGPEKLAIDEELDRAQRRPGLRLNLRHDADAARNAAPAERRRNAHGRSGSVAGAGGGPMTSVQAGLGLREENGESEADHHVNHT